jgi:hypothetical protein
MLILLLIIFVKTVGSLTVLGLLEPKVLEVLETNQTTAQEGCPTLTLVHASRPKAHRLEEKGN